MKRRRLPNGRFCSTDHKKIPKPLKSHRCCWRFILPYLNLADLESFARSGPTRRNLVDKYLKQGDPLVIDANILWRFPLTREYEMYRYYGPRVKHVLFKSLQEVELVYLLECFELIEELTLINVNIGYGHTFTNFPRCHTLLVIDSEFFNYNLLFDCMKNLQCLYLKNNKESWILELPTLRSLTFINQEYDPFQIKLPKLEELTFALPWLGMTTGKFQKPVSVECFGNPKHLRILNSVDWKLKEYIDSLELESIDMYCCEIPEEEGLILKLNDDCLHHLHTFLPMEDIVNFRKAHPRFSGIPSTTAVKYTIIDHFLYQIQLTIDKKGLNKFISLMKHFNHLTELDLAFDFFKSYENLIPSGLRKLTMHDLGSDRSNFDMTELFRRLNPTLKELSLTSGVFRKIRGLCELYHITEFRSEQVTVTDEFIDFWNQNKNHLRTIVLRFIEFDEQNTWQSKLFTTVFQMENLQSLSIYGNYENAPCVDLGSLHSLENLTLLIWDNKNQFVQRYKEQLIEVLSSLDGSRLRVLRLSQGLVGFDRSICEKLQSVQKLQFDEFESEPMREHLFKVITWLPSLTELETRDWMEIG